LGGEGRRAWWKGQQGRSAGEQHRAKAREREPDETENYRAEKEMLKTKMNPETAETKRNSSSNSPHWRFQDLEIWQMAAELAADFHRLAARLDERRFYRYAEQLRAAGLSVSNNIAEGSASPHPQEFLQFLNIARRSLFEDASMLLVFQRIGLLQNDEIHPLCSRADMLSRKITSFAKNLRANR
jgi:four helix bundle protein